MEEVNFCSFGGILRQAQDSINTLECCKRGAVNGHSSGVGTQCRDSMSDRAARFYLAATRLVVRTCRRLMMSGIKFVIDDGMLCRIRVRLAPLGIHCPSPLDHKRSLWTDKRWRAGPLSAANYELHFGTFTPEELPIGILRLFSRPGYQQSNLMR